MTNYSKIDKHAAEGNVDRILHERSTYGHGTQGQLPSFYRYAVLDVVFDPQIVDKTKIEYWEHTLGVSNPEWAAVLPRNTIIGQRVYEGSEEPPIFLFPFFPSHIALPCKPGEHVWVMFEAPGTKDHTLGYWFCKITEPHFVDDVNHTHAPRVYESSFVPKIKDVFDGTAEPKFEFRNGRADTQEGTRYTAADSSVLQGPEDVYEKLLTETDASNVMKYEAVPRFRKRPGDLAIEGSNNTLIVLGTDRVGPVADESKPSDPQKGVIPAKLSSDLDGESGTIDLVVGRGQTPKTLGTEVTSKKIDGSDFNKELNKSSDKLTATEGDPDYKNDRSRILISQRTMVDKNFGIDQFNKREFSTLKSTTSPDVNIDDPKKGAGAVVISTDKVRIIARRDVEILVTGYKDDNKGHAVTEADSEKYAAIVIKSNGDIIFKPSKLGYVKLGGEDASFGIVCSDTPVAATNGGVSGPPLITTMGGSFAATAPGGDNNLAIIPGQGKYANKVLVK